MTVKRVQHILQDPQSAEIFIGLEGELIVEQESYLIRVHDGVTPGGFATLTLAVALARFITNEDFSEAQIQLRDELETLNTEAVAAILGSVLVCRGPVLEIITAPPGSPGAGSRYLVAHSGTSGILVGKEDQVLEYKDSVTPQFSGAPLQGHSIFNVDDETEYYFNGVTWTTTNPDVTLETRFTGIETDVTTLTTEIALKADLASPAFTGTPTAPTAAVDTDTTQIATTAFVNGQIVSALTAGGAGGFDDSPNANGFIQMPGGILFQWCDGVEDPADDSQTTQVINFPMTFPTECLHAQVTSRISTASSNIDSWYQIVGNPGASQITVQRQHGSGGIYGGGTTKPRVFAVGH